MIYRFVDVNKRSVTGTDANRVSMIYRSCRWILFISSLRLSGAWLSGC